MRNVDDYHYARAVAELDVAQRSLCPEAVQAQYTLAELHLERASARRPPNLFELRGDSPESAGRFRQSLAEDGSVVPLRQRRGRD
ncbi:MULTISPECIES: hypothetical protein [Sphingomonas]|uniref:Uncharacterized protein n=1 Tax=Sphingomonas trueperi TaxID=53317 RepID=A0A7X5Y2I9_9SPHN|nr:MULTISPECIES: hypothetical protein [Sphingomonas]NJB99924.1 hypothetical protein [Sphingomonas trueperi]